MSKKSLALILILAAIAGILVYAGTAKHTGQPTTNTVQQATTTVSVAVDTGDGKPTTYAVQNPTDATAFGVLKQAAETNGIVLVYDPPGQYGVFVKAIAGKTGSDKQFWIYQVNGQDGQVAADKMAVKTGDAVTWKFTSASAN